MTDLTKPDHYRVAVPSYRRADMLAKRTLPFLLDGDVTPGRITVFVHNHDEQHARGEYVAVAERFGVNLVATDARGINAQRAAIRAHYPEGTPLVQADDDITDIRAAVDAKTLTKVRNVDGFFREMFTLTADAGLFSWGLTPVANAYFMKPDRINDGLKFVIFSLFGNVVRHGHPVYENTVPTKDDYEFSLRSWWYDGGIIRHEGYVAKADIYKAPGGCQDTRTVAAAEQSVQSLMAQWPGLVRRNTRRKSDFPEILLARRPRHAGNAIDVPPPGVSISAD